MDDVSVPSGCVLWNQNRLSVFTFFITGCKMGGYNCLDDISVPSGCVLWNQNRLSVFTFFITGCKMGGYTCLDDVYLLFVGNCKMAEVDV